MAAAGVAWPASPLTSVSGGAAAGVAWPASPLTSVSGGAAAGVAWPASPLTSVSGGAAAGVAWPASPLTSVSGGAAAGVAWPASPLTSVSGGAAAGVAWPASPLTSVSGGAAAAGRRGPIRHRRLRVRVQLLADLLQAGPPLLGFALAAGQVSGQVRGHVGHDLDRAAEGQAVGLPPLLGVHGRLADGHRASLRAVTAGTGGQRVPEMLKARQLAVVAATPPPPRSPRSSAPRPRCRRSCGHRR